MTSTFPILAEAKVGSETWMIDLPFGIWIPQFNVQNRCFNLCTENRGDTFETSPTATYFFVDEPKVRVTFHVKKTDVSYKSETPSMKPFLYVVFMSPEKKDGKPALVTENVCVCMARDEQHARTIAISEWIDESMDLDRLEVVVRPF